jgi:hypothetical protein
MCAGCGYGVVVTAEPERCPICGWHRLGLLALRPFSGGGS